MLVNNVYSYRISYNRYCDENRETCLYRVLQYHNIVYRRQQITINDNVFVLCYKSTLTTTIYDISMFSYYCYNNFSN